MPLPVPPTRTMVVPAQLIGVPLSVKVTLPVGVGDPCSWAVRVIVDPMTTGFFDEVRVKPAGRPVESTATDSDPDMEGAYVVSPSYREVTQTVPPTPGANAGVKVQVATPLPFSGAAGHGVVDEVPMVAVKVATPVARPAPPVTVEVTVIGAALGTGWDPGEVRTGVPDVEAAPPFTV